jgi:hypothetical protein
VKRLIIKEFKTNHRILECGGWSLLLVSMEMYPVGESLSGKIGLRYGKDRWSDCMHHGTRPGYPVRK